ncbi:MAG: type II toxin-antitoxin system Phd/YefM family antitoxin [Opitutales bacterium]
MHAVRFSKQGFGRIVEAAQHEPVLLKKHQRPAAVRMSVEDYQRLAQSTGAEARTPDKAVDLEPTAKSLLLLPRNRRRAASGLNWRKPTNPRPSSGWTPTLRPWR